MSQTLTPKPPSAVGKAGIHTGKLEAQKGFSRHWLGLGLVLPLTLWLLLAFLLPLLMVLLLSLQASSDPFAPISWIPSLAQFARLAGDPYYLRIFLNTLGLAVVVTLGCVVLAYPLALWLNRLPPKWKSLGVALVLIPLLTNVVVRSLGIIQLLSPDGLLNSLLRALRLGSVNLLFTSFAVAVALVQVFLPFMVISLFDALQSIDSRLLEAADSLGAGPVRRFFRVTLPLSLPGLRAGVVLVFLLASTSYVSARLLGGNKVWVNGMVVFEEALQILNQPLAAALSMAMLVVAIAITWLINLGMIRMMTWLPGIPRPAPEMLIRIRIPEGLRRNFWSILEWVGPWLGRGLLGLGLGLLLFPLGLVVVNSVNDVRMASIAAFAGFTGKWYALVFTDGAYLGSFWISMRLALASTAVSLALALPAAFALVRYPLPRREWVGAFFLLPLALPGIAIAIGMLRLLQWFLAIPPFLGLLAVHVVLIAPFALVMLRTNVMQLDPSLEEAAQSLGAPGWQVFLRVILPHLMPGLMAAGIIAFLISFGEVTVTAFLTTARLTTLPVRIYSEAQFLLEPTVSAVSTLLIGVTAGLLLLANRFTRLDRVWHR